MVSADEDSRLVHVASQAEAGGCRGFLSETESEQSRPHKFRAASSTLSLGLTRSLESTTCYVSYS